MVSQLINLLIADRPDSIRFMHFLRFILIVPNLGLFLGGICLDNATAKRVRHESMQIEIDLDDEEKVTLCGIFYP